MAVGCPLGLYQSCCAAGDCGGSDASIVLLRDVCSDDCCNNMDRSAIPMLLSELHHHCPHCITIVTEPTASVQTHTNAL